MTMRERERELIFRLEGLEVQDLLSDVVLFTSFYKEIQAYLEEVRKENHQGFFIAREIYNLLEELAFAEDVQAEGPRQLQVKIDALLAFLTGVLQTSPSEFSSTELSVAVSLGDAEFRELVPVPGLLQDLQPFLLEFSSMSEYWQELDSSLSKGNLSRNQLQELYRGVHSLKGTSSFFEVLQDTIPPFCHELETFLANLLERGDLANLEESQALSRSLRFLQAMFQNLQSALEGDRRRVELNLEQSLEQLKRLNTGSAFEVEKIMSSTRIVGGGQTAVRIPADQMDDLADRLQKILLSISRVYREQDLSRLLFREVELIEKRIRGVQDRILDLRLFSVAGLFERCERQVHDLSSRLDKKVTLSFQGSDTRVDKQISDGVFQPLVHLINNAIDHGIEEEREREKAGKPIAGKLTIRAYYRSNRVVFEVEDDGRGLNESEILNKAEKMGLNLNFDSIPRDHLLLRLITQPGFSTKSTLSQTSGRGVGMDVVSNQIRQLGGTLGMETREEEGTLFRIQLPLSFFTSECLVIEGARGKLCLLLSNVHSVLRVSQLEPSQNQQLQKGHLVYEGEDLKVASLNNSVFQSNGEAEDTLLLLKDTYSNSFGLLVEKCSSKETLLIQPMGNSLLNQLTLTRSAGILSDGSLSCVLDIDELASLVNKQSEAQP